MSAAGLRSLRRPGPDERVRALGGSQGLCAGRAGERHPLRRWDEQCAIYLRKILGRSGDGIARSTHVRMSTRARRCINTRSACGMSAHNRRDQLRVVRLITARQPADRRGHCLPETRQVRHGRPGDRTGHARPARQGRRSAGGGRGHAARGTRATTRSRWSGPGWLGASCTRDTFRRPWRC